MATSLVPGLLCEATWQHANNHKIRGGQSLIKLTVCGTTNADVVSIRSGNVLVQSTHPQFAQ